MKNQLASLILKVNDPTVIPSVANPKVFRANKHQPPVMEDGKWPAILQMYLMNWKKDTCIPIT